EDGAGAGGVGAGRIYLILAIATAWFVAPSSPVAVATTAMGSNINERPVQPECLGVSRTDVTLCGPGPGRSGQSMTITPSSHEITLPANPSNMAACGPSASCSWSSRPSGDHRTIAAIRSAMYPRESLPDNDCIQRPAQESWL